MKTEMSEVAELTDVRRRELFAAVVDAQDGGQSVRASREAMARRYNVDVETVAEIEDEGIEKGWPPFGK